MRIFLTVTLLAGLSLLSVAEPSNVATMKIWDSGEDRKEKVYIQAFIPEDYSKCSKAVIVCPGGSYFWLADKTEGKEVGEWLCDNGIAAFVLSYRVAGKFNFATDFRYRYTGRSHPAMLEDAQRAVQFLRSRGKEFFGISPDAIGIMGFSAGGHLALLAEEMESESSLQLSGVSPKPDFIAMIYPVVTMSDESIVHKRSRRGLMGSEKQNRELKEKLSLEKNIPEDCCPVFLVNCLDDETVDYRNSAVLDSALNVMDVPHKYYCFPKGGHGFGIRPIRCKDSTYSWTSEFINWISEL